MDEIREKTILEWAEQGILEDILEGCDCPGIELR